MLKYDDAGALQSVNLDVKNPTGPEALEHLPPDQLIDDILAKEREIIAILEEMKVELTEGWE